MNQFYLHYGKRIFDLILVIAILVTFSWLFLLITFCYCITWKFPIFFLQPRIGKKSVSFIMYKFRTLSTQEEKALQERRFRLGDFLRATNLDELPQLWNVLKGEMSLIGPRPLPMEYLPLFKDEEKKRLEVRPGVTGWTQIKERHSIAWQEKFKLDTYYVDHLSFFLDLKILLKTIVLIFSFRKDVSLEEEKFTGN